jgi:hypothetical protein
VAPAGEASCARLHRAQRGPVEGCLDGAAGHLLDRVGHGQHGDHGLGTCAHRGHHPREDLRGGESPGRVVHQHHVDIVGKGSESGGHGLLTRLAAVDDGQRDIADRGAQQGLDGGAVSWRGCHHDEVDLAGVAQTMHRMHEQRDTGDLAKRLRGTGSKAFTASGCRHDGGGRQRRSSSTHRRDPRPSAGGHDHAQEARTSSSRASALSSLVCSHRASSETRI